MAKALVACALSGGLLAAAAIGDVGSSRPPESCGAWTELESDALGTVRMECIGRRGELTHAERPPRGMARLLDGARIDLNRAGLELLQALPGIGPTRAASLVRARSGEAFAALEEIERTPGIGPVLRSRLARWICVGDADTSEDCDV